MLLKIGEKLGFQTGTMVEVCKHIRPIAFIRPIIWILGDSNGKICEKTLHRLQIEEGFDIIMELERLAAWSGV